LAKWFEKRNCLSSRSTWVHPQFLVGFVLLDLFICMFCRSLFVL
jgi:hypothetical protein